MAIKRPKTAKNSHTMAKMAKNEHKTAKNGQKRPKIATQMKPLRAGGRLSRWTHTKALHLVSQFEGFTGFQSRQLLYGPPTNWDVGKPTPDGASHKGVFLGDEIAEIESFERLLQSIRRCYQRGGWALPITSRAT